MRHFRLFVRYSALPIALVSSCAEGLTSIPALADLSFWIYQLLHSDDNSYNNSESFIKDHRGILSFILCVAACGVLTDYMLEGKNFVKQMRKHYSEPPTRQEQDQEHDQYHVIVNME